MKNNLILITAFTFIFGCTTSLTSNGNTDYVSRIDGVSFVSNKDDIIKSFGETKDSGSNEKDEIFSAWIF